MALYEYMKDVTRFMSEKNQALVNPEDMVVWINRARRTIAERSQCLRVLAPISGSVQTLNLITGGSNYSAPVVVITSPDFPSGSGSNPLGVQATATATQLGGAINSLTIVNAGSGYFQPQVTITDPTGSGAIVTASVSPISATQQGKEVYLFSDFPLTNFPGFGQIYMVRSVSFIYANYRYSIPIYSFSTYQARIRNFPYQYSYVPTMGAQFGQGTSGSLYFYPLPSTVYQFEADAQCLPIDLVDDTTVEAIPLPWTDGVAFLAASYGFMSLQNLNAAAFYEQMFDRVTKGFSAAARPGRRTNPNGSW